MEKCEKCGNKVLLANGYITCFEVDDEPYDGGVIEDPETEISEINKEYSIHIEYCEKCGNVNTVWVDDEKELKRAEVLKKENDQLKLQIETLKCCENCEYNYAPDYCNYHAKTKLSCRDNSGWTLKKNIVDS